MVRGYLVREGPATLGYWRDHLGFGIEFGGPDIFLDDLYLVPEARGRPRRGRCRDGSIGAEALRHKARAIHLVVAPGNERAQRASIGVAGSRARGGLRCDEQAPWTIEGEARWHRSH